MSHPPAKKLSTPHITRQTKMKLHFSHPAARLISIANIIGGTPSVAASRIIGSHFADFRQLLSYRDFLAVRRFAKISHRFYGVLWNIWSGAKVTALPLP